MSNRNMLQSRATNMDGFYTRLTDIEKEMVHYKSHFKGKTVFCPCDDSYASQFFQYFSKNFEHLGLKRLITACYKSTDPFQMSDRSSDRSIWLEYMGDKNGNRVPDLDEIGVHYFEGDGDFRSDESLELLREADIIVTSPPTHSLLKDFMDVMMTEKKHFLVVACFNAVMYTESWKRIIDGKFWLGCNHIKEFIKPDGGTQKFGNIVWFTNLSHKMRNENLVCYQRFDAADYPVYDNYNAIEVSKVRDIPTDYDGVMGVPSSFLEKYNPAQFEIIGADHDIKNGLLPELVNAKWKGKIDRAYLKGKRMYSRIFIRHRKTD